jgi:hypothetical protein
MKEIQAEELHQDPEAEKTFATRKNLYTGNV